MSEEQQEEWKNKWLAKGLPESLLDEMINEANDEYTAELQYAPYDAYATLDVHVIDDPLQEGEFYIYLCQRADWIFQGIGTLDDHFLFSQIPTVEIVAEVFKMLYDGELKVIGFGWLLFNHTKDEEIEVVINLVSGDYKHYPDWEYVMFNIDDGVIDLYETVASHDSGYEERNITPTESVVIINT